VWVKESQFALLAVSFKDSAIMYRNHQVHASSLPLSLSLARSLSLALFCVCVWVEHTQHSPDGHTHTPVRVSSRLLLSSPFPSLPDSGGAFQMMDEAELTPPDQATLTYTRPPAGLRQVLANDRSSRGSYKTNYHTPSGSGGGAGLFRG
jgi:hypothetical protein